MKVGIEWRIEDGVALAALVRREARNALCRQMVDELDALLAAWTDDEAVRVVLLYGAGDHFAAGADLKEMLPMTAADALLQDYAGCSWRLATFPKPTVAAVDGYALGGGCELVEMCDIVIASERARFGHPELLVGTMPGAGGTQRLPRVLGKHVAMDMFLTGRQLGAQEALQHGLVSRVVEASCLLESALAVAKEVARRSQPVARMIKTAVQAGLEDASGPSLALERRLFQLGFDLQDRREGMSAFVEKRDPVFRHR